MTALLRPATEVALSSAFFFGVLLGLAGSLKLTLARSLNPGEGKVAVLLRVENLALTLVFFLAGFLIDSIGIQPVVVLGSVAAAFSVFGLSYPRNAFGSFLSVLTGCLGAAGLGVASMVLMPLALFPHKPTASLNLGILFFATGALITPPLLDVLMRLIGIKRALVLISFACLIPGLSAAVVSSSELRVEAAESADIGASLSRSTLWLACLVYLLYAPLEASISSWASAYLKDKKSGDGRATKLLSAFWCTFVASRLIVAGLMVTDYFHADWDAWSLVVPALLAAVVLGNMAGMVGTNWAYVGLPLLGLCLGPIAPTLFGMILTPPEQGSAQCEGTAIGMILAAGSLGTLIATPLVAWSVRSDSPQSALRVQMLLALLLTAVALLFGLRV
jgi:hypothetical protein